MQASYEEAMAVITGQNNQHEQQKLSAEDRKKIQAAFQKMYSGLVMTKWSGGDKSLGQSMFNGMEQMDKYVQTQGDNIAADYLRQVNAVNRVRASKEMMTNEKRDEKLECTPEQRTEYKKRANNMVSTNMSELDLLIARYQAAQQDKHKKPVQQQKPEFAQPEQASQTQTVPQNAKPQQPSRNAHIQDTPAEREKPQIQQEREFAAAKKAVLAKIKLQMWVNKQQQYGAAA